MPARPAPPLPPRPPLPPPPPLALPFAQDNMLHIRTHTIERSRDDLERAGFVVHKKERFETSSWRNFQLPADVDTAVLTARLEHGELHLRLPKSIVGGGPERTLRVPVVGEGA